MAGSKSPDILVVGAGIAGAATACFLARDGLSVALVDARHPAFGASGRNPGFLWLQTKPSGYTMDFALAGRRFAQAIADELPDFGFRASGGLVVYRDEALRGVAEDFARDRQAAGLPVSHIDGDEARALCPVLGRSIAGALWNPLDAHQDTRRLVDALVADGERRGVSPRWEARAERVLVEGRRCRGVALADGTRIDADLTILATGPWSNALLEPLGLALPLNPIRFEAAETEPAPFLVGPVVCGQALFKFFNASGRSREELPSHPAERARPDLGFTEQVAQRSDGALLYGCAFVEGTDDDEPTDAGQAMADAVTADNIQGFRNLSVRRRWAGVVAGTPDGLPVIDMAPGIEGLGLNLAHFFGNLAGAFSGRLCADLMLEREPAFDVAPLRRARFDT